MKNYKLGYTLIEIVVVTIIVAVISSIAFVNFGTVVERQKAKEGEQILAIIYNRFLVSTVEYGWRCMTFANRVDITFGPSENFGQPYYSCWGEPPNPPAIPLAIAITRKKGNDSLYVLQLDTNQQLIPLTVTCSSTTAGLCEKLGYEITQSTTPPDPF